MSCMKQLYRFMFIMYAVLFTSCSGNANNENNNSGHTTSEEVKNNAASMLGKPLVLEAFNDLPEVIDGCACLFSENSAAFRKGEFLYADNLLQTGFVRINGKMQQVVLEESESNPDIEFKIRGKNEEVEIKLDLRKSDQIDYVGSYFGILEVETKDGRTARKTVFGECGC